MNSFLAGKYQAVAVGRVMTCVVGMVVRREREIRDFVKTPFYRVLAELSLAGRGFDGEWRSAPGSLYEIHRNSIRRMVSRRERTRKSW